MKTSSSNSDRLTSIARRAAKILDKFVRAQPANDFDPPVLSRIVKFEGSKRTVRLIDYRSLRAHLDSLPTAGKEPEPTRA